MIIIVTVAIVPLKVESCKDCPHSVTWVLEVSKWFCGQMKGKTFTNPLIVQDWCPYQKKGGE